MCGPPSSTATWRHAPHGQVRPPSVSEAASARRVGHCPVATMANLTARSARMARPSETFSTSTPVTTAPPSVTTAAGVVKRSTARTPWPSHRGRSGRVRRRSVQVGRPRPLRSRVCRRPEPKTCSQLQECECPGRRCPGHSTGGVDRPRPSGRAATCLDGDVSRR